MIYNGEIYNYIELREELTQQGVFFSSSSDTEVLLATWCQWGLQGLTKLKGMFAFVIFDAVEHRIFLGRDFFGIKPLYYCSWRDGIGVCSEIAPLIMLPGVSGQLSAQALYDFLAYGSTDMGEETLLCQINAVEPASLVEIDAMEATVIAKKTFWSINALTRPIDISFAEATKRVRSMFLDNVKLHLRSDVAIGSTLSGGIDSSAIVCSVREISSSAEIHTFTFDSQNEQKSEARWADLVGKRVGAIQHFTKPTISDFVENIHDLAKRQGEPFGSLSIYGQYKVFELAKRNGIKVLLDGQGADEIFAGYNHFISLPLLEKLARFEVLAAWRYLNAVPRIRSMPPHHVVAFAIEQVAPIAVSRLLRRLSGKSNLASWLDRGWFKGRVDTDYHPAAKVCTLRDCLIRGFSGYALRDLLRYEDRNSMAFSVESRVPFLTPEFVNFVLALPTEYIISEQGVTKHVFRSAMRGIVPDEILDRKDKIGFEAPENIWLARPLPIVQQAIGALCELPFVDSDAAFAALRKVETGEAARSAALQVWRSISLGLFALGLRQAGALPAVN
jgi:asparagine synthase (glutamine-hydrolysing)